MIQFVNPDSILNLKHLLFAIKQSFYAKNNQLLAARDFEVDLLMRISITDQIQEALKFSGITPKNQSYILISVGNKSNFYKKAAGKIKFICDEGKNAKELINLTKQNRTHKAWLKAIGIDQSGDIVSEFYFEWSCKCR